MIDYTTSGLLAPAISTAVAFVGAFLGMRAASRARACRGLSRARWLCLAGFAAGGLAAWAADFIAQLGFTVRGHTISYNVPLIAADAAVCVAIMCAGLLAAGLGRTRRSCLITSGVVAGLGLTVMHYAGLTAMQLPARTAYSPAPLAASAVLAVAAALTLVWAGVRAESVWRTFLAAAVVTIALSGMHYSAMAAVRLYQAPRAVSGTGGVTGQGLLLPLIISISVAVFLIWAIIALSPTAAAMSYDESLLDRIARHTRAPLEETPMPPPKGAVIKTKSSPPWTFAQLRPPAPPPAVRVTGRPRLAAAHLDVIGRPDPAAQRRTAPRPPAPHAPALQAPVPQPSAAQAPVPQVLRAPAPRPAADQAVLAGDGHPVTRAQQQRPAADADSRR